MNTYNGKVYSWTCECGYEAKSKRDLYSHKKEFHNTTKGQAIKMYWTCQFCGHKSFSRKSDKSLHENVCKMNPNRTERLGHKVSEETKIKISESMKLAHKEGRANTWKGRSERSYAEQSWYNIFANDLGEKTFVNNYFVIKYWLDFAWPDKKLYFEVDGRTHFTEDGIKHDQERTAFLKKEGWTLIGRCNWSEYQKLSKEEKEKFVQNIEQKILTGNPNG